MFARFKRGNRHLGVVVVMSDDFNGVYHRIGEHFAAVRKPALSPPFSGAFAGGIPVNVTSRIDFRLRTVFVCQTVKTGNPIGLRRAQSKINRRRVLASAPILSARMRRHQKCGGMIFRARAMRLAYRPTT